jgi:hypothetical protein
MAVLPQDIRNYKQPSGILMPGGLFVYGLRRTTGNGLEYKRLKDDNQKDKENENYTNR